MSQQMPHQNIRLLTWFNFFLDFRPYNPIAIIYFSQVTGSFALGLAVFSAQSVGACIFEVPTGIFSDWVGRKKTMFLGAVASTLAILFYAIGASFWMLALGGLFAGLAESLFSGNNDALLYETLKEQRKEEEYAEFLGKLSSMFQIGLGISALLGGFMAGISLALVFWISLIPQAINVFITIFIKEPHKHYNEVNANLFHHLKKALMGFKNNWKLRTLSLSSIFSFGIGEVMHQFAPAFFSLVWPTWALGIPRTLSHIFAAISFHFSGRIIKKFKALRILLLESWMSRLISLVAYGIPNFISPLLVSSTSLGFGVSMISRNALMQKEFTEYQRATMSSLNNFFGNVLFAIFAYLFGLLADHKGPVIALLMGQILLLPLSYWYWKLFHHDKKTSSLA